MGSFELLVPSEFPMRGAVCLLETPCGSPKEMGFGQEGLSLLYQDHGPISGAIGKALGGRSRVGPPGVPKKRVNIGMADGEGGIKERGQGESGALKGVLPVNPLRTGSRCPGWNPFPLQSATTLMRRS